MYEKEMIKFARDLGYSEHMRNADGSWRMLTHEYYPFVLELWVETNEFLLRYNTGMFVFQSGKCGSFTNREHFLKFQRQMSKYVSYIREAEIDIDSRRKI